MNVEELEKSAEKIFQRYNRFNDYILNKIAKMIGKIGKAKLFNDKKYLKEFKKLLNKNGDLKKIYSKLTKLTNRNLEDIKRLYIQVIVDADKTYRPLYDFKNIEPLPFAQNDFAIALAQHWYEETKDEMINLSRTKAIGFVNRTGKFVGLEKAYQKIIDDAVVDVSSGTVDFNSAMKQTILELGGSGVRTDYGEGVTRSLDSAIRASILYGAKQAAQAYDEHITKVLDLDGWEIDAHAGCRPSHMIMQGGIYAAENKPVTVEGKKYNGIDENIGTAALDGSGSVQGLLNDYGCLHFKTGFLIGVSQPRYSKEQLNKIKEETKKLIEYDGKKKTLYEWKQTQRAIERKIRENKINAEMFKIAGDNVHAKEYRDLARKMREKYNDMTDSIDELYPKPERMRTYF